MTICLSAPGANCLQLNYLYLIREYGRYLILTPGTG